MNKNERGDAGTVFLVLMAGFVGLVLFFGILFVGREVGWWLKKDNANRDAHVVRAGYSNQETLREQITKGIADINRITVQIAQTPTAAQPLGAQRIAIVNIVCDLANKVQGDPLSPDAANFVSANCYAGSISSTSLYNL